MFSKINDKKLLKVIKDILSNKCFKSSTCVAVSLFYLLNCAGSMSLESNENSEDVEVDTNLIEAVRHITYPNIHETEEVEIVEEVDKFAVVCERENLTYKQLDTVLAGCVAEACEEGLNYDDAYSVANTIYNRAERSYSCIDYISSIMGEGLGNSYYYQFIAPDQFTVYADESYKKYLGRSDLIGYQAALDMFYSEEVKHDYLFFRGNKTEVSCSYEKFAENGNKYFKEIAEEDMLDNTLVLSRSN